MLNSAATLDPQLSLFRSKKSPGADLPELTSLRVFAALCVVVSHMHALGFVYAPRLHSFLDGGRPAVAFFFVLSGFIMHHVYPGLRASDSAATRRYALTRFARLYPTIVLGLLVALPSVSYLLATHDSRRVMQLYALKDSYGLKFSESAFAQLAGLTGWIPAAAINQPWNGPAWSLSCEFFFYAIFPFILPRILRSSTRSLIMLVSIAWLVQDVAIQLIKDFAPQNRAGLLISQFPLIHVFEFFLGVCAGVFLARARALQLWLVLAFGGIASVTLAIGLHLTNITMPVYYPLTPLFAIIVVIVARFSGASFLAPLRQRSLIALGHASYALYMVHIPILVAASVFGLGTSFGWFWVPILLFLSVVVHFLFAEPMRRWVLRCAAADLPPNPMPKAP